VVEFHPENSLKDAKGVFSGRLIGIPYPQKDLLSEYYEVEVTHLKDVSHLRGGRTASSPGPTVLAWVMREARAARGGERSAFK
jgi:hypothetical protein